LNSSVVQVTDEVLLWYNRGGVYMYAGGTQPVLVSRPVKEVLDVVQDADKVSAGIDSEMRYCLHIGDINYNGDSLKDVVLRYDPLMNSWTILTDRKPRYWTLNHAGGVYESYGIDGSVNGENAVYQADIGYSLIGDSQKSLYQSPKIFGTDVANVHDLKNGYKLQVAYKPTGNDEYLSVSFRADGTGEWKYVDNKTDNISLASDKEIEVVELRLPMGVVGKFLEVRFEHESEVGGFEIYAVNVIYDINENAYN
jgi:hypothetical protein